MDLTIVLSRGTRHRAPCEACGETTQIQRVEARIACLPGVLPLDLCRACRTRAAYPDAHYHVDDGTCTRLARTLAEARAFALQLVAAEKAILEEKLVLRPDGKSGLRFRQAGVVDVIECASVSSSAEEVP